jgi:hypothetical protein
VWNCVIHGSCALSHVNVNVNNNNDDDGGDDDDDDDNNNNNKQPHQING